MDKDTSNIGSVIKGAACLEEGMAWLSKKEPRFGEIYKELDAPLSVRQRESGYSALLRSIVSQQLSVASAKAIWTRMEQAKLITPEAMSKADEATLRETGLSGPKQRYAKALATSNIDYAALQTKPDAEIVKTLTAVAGIGVWTAEIYAMFSLGRADLFPAGDLALQESTRIAFALTERPSEKKMRQRAENWSPWRSVAALLLWDYYRFAKNREGVT